jgi:hypothetical protein
MPYSHLLMILIFIKVLCDRAGAAGDLCVRAAAEGGWLCTLKCGG